MVHRERYEMSKYMTNEQVVKYLYDLREKTVPVYGHFTSGRPGVRDQT